MTVTVSDSPGEMWHPVMPRVPRPAAVETFAEALVKAGLSPEAATAASNAVVDPDDARRRLSEPAHLRVQGGTLLVLDVTVWSAALSVYPANPRELGQRLYRASGAAGDREDVFRTLRAARDRQAELAVTVKKPSGLADRLREAEAWLAGVNDLTHDIRVEGVLQAAVVSALSVAHRDRSAPLTILSAIDGSSRTSAVHRILNLDPGELAYDLPPGSRGLRQLLGRQLRECAGEWDELTEQAQQRARALTMPARLIVGYLPAATQPVTYDVAVRNLIGLTHIRPPARYGTHVENRAKADAVLDYLAEAVVDGEPYLSLAEVKWFRGDLTADEAEVERLSSALDVRAADIVRALIHGSNRTAIYVNRGIRALTAKQFPSRNERIDLAVELALRPVQSSFGIDNEDSLAARRAALQRAFRLAGLADEDFGGPIWEGLPYSPLTLERLRDQALDEVANPLPGRRLQSSQLELAIKAAVYMVTAEPMALRREGYGVDTDRTSPERSIPVILENMLRRRQGVIQAVAIIEAGRAGQPLFVADDDGEPLKGEDGPVRLSDALVRELYSKAPLSGTQTGLVAAEAKWAHVVDAVTDLAASIEQMAQVRHTNGLPYVDHAGWPSRTIGPLRMAIDKLDRRLGSWADLSDDLEARIAQEDDDAGDEVDEVDEYEYGDDPEAHA